MAEVKIMVVNKFLIWLVVVFLIWGAYASFVLHPSKGKDYCSSCSVEIGLTPPVPTKDAIKQKKFTQEKNIVTPVKPEKSITK